MWNKHLERAFEHEERVQAQTGVVYYTYVNIDRGGYDTIPANDDYKPHVQEGLFDEHRD